MNSKNAKGLWKSIHRIPNPKSTALEGNVNDINKFFNSTGSRITGKGPLKTSDIYRTITSLLENSTTQLFALQAANSGEVLKMIKSLRNDSLTGYDNIPIFDNIPI